MMKRLTAFVLGLLAAAAGRAEAVDISVTPRVWLMFDNENQRTSPNLNGALDPGDLGLAFDPARAELPPEASLELGATRASDAEPGQAFFPMAGGTVAVQFEDENRSSLTLTVLRGTTNQIGEANIVQPGRWTFGPGAPAFFDGRQIDDLLVINTKEDREATRTDVELTFQRSMSPTFALVAGARYERVAQVVAATQTASITQNAQNAVDDSLARPRGPDFVTTVSVSQVRGSLDRVSLRGGATAFVPIDDFRRLYVSGLAFVSHSPGYDFSVDGALAGVSFSDQADVPSETSIGPDLSFGYAHLLRDDLGFDVRYRGVFAFTVDGVGNFEDPRVSHGLMLSLTYWFGLKAPR